MEQQQVQQVEQRLRQNWRQIRYRILDQFAQVSPADLDSAINVNDLMGQQGGQAGSSQGQPFGGPGQ
jgi:hypothetical protein